MAKFQIIHPHAVDLENNPLEVGTILETEKGSELATFLQYKGVFVTGVVVSEPGEKQLVVATPSDDTEPVNTRDENEDETAVEKQARLNKSNKRKRK